MNDFNTKIRVMAQEEMKDFEKWCEHESMNHLTEEKKFQIYIFQCFASLQLLIQRQTKNVRDLVQKLKKV